MISYRNNLQVDDRKITTVDNIAVMLTEVFQNHSLHHKIYIRQSLCWV